MKVSVLGLGYVGSVMTGCLARAGHDVVGVDIRPEKVDTLASGFSPVVEPGLGQLIEKGHTEGLITATTEAAEAVRRTAMSFVCVGTPAVADGSVDTTAVERVCRHIGQALAGDGQESSDGHEPHTVVIRSTVMPGAFQRCREALEVASGRELGQGTRPITLCFNPEFLREGSAIDDFMTAPFTLVGTSEPSWAEPLRELYGFLSETPLLVVEPGAAEILKLVCNAWHAAKVCFANEVGRLCETNDIDGQTVMDLFARDARLNLSAAYLKPGFAYGGSCLPKDLGALIHLARSSQLDLPLIDGLPRSNMLHIERAKSKILATGCRRVGFLGLSFKKGTDDLRGSPQVDLVEFCIGKGLSVRIYDPTVQPDRLVGRNREVAFERLGHLAELLLPTLDAMTEHAELIVIGHRDKSFADYCRTLPESIRVLDLVGMMPAAPAR